MHPDAVVVGAGIVGASIAYELAKAGLRTVVVERGEIGREASWAAGGVLTPVHVAEYPTPLADLCLEAQRIYPAFVAELEEDPEYEVSGMSVLVRDAEDEETARTLEDWQRSHDRAVERTPEGLLLPDVAQIRNHRLTRAVAAAAAKHGAEFRTRTEVTGFLKVPGRVNGVRTSEGDIQAGTTILAAGAWSASIADRLDVPLPVRPVKGQMVLAQMPPGTLSRILLHRDQYLIPRRDGMILIGSTVEEAGFDPSVTVGAVEFLLRRAAEIFPPIRSAPIRATWAGLRPGTPDRLPVIGPAPGFERLLLATGHFRNGILLGPLTGRLVASLVRGETPGLLENTRPDRF